MKALAAVAATIVVLATPATARTPPPPARVQVVADEFNLALSRRTIPPGPVIVELTNFGEDPHDLRVRRLADGTPTMAIELVTPGEQGYLRARLRPGRFLLWCSVADHRQLGMQAVLTVKKPPPKSKRRR
jgi:hypothetical protein